jgi:hypothetical protein
MEHHQLESSELRRAAHELFPGVVPIVIGRKEYRGPSNARVYEEHDLTVPAATAETNWELMERFRAEAGVIHRRMEFIRDRCASALLRIDPVALRQNRAKELAKTFLFPRAKYILRVTAAQHIYTFTETDGARRIVIDDVEIYGKKNHPALKTEIAGLFDGLDEMEEWTGKPFELKTTNNEIGICRPTETGCGFWLHRETCACRFLSLNSVTVS